MHKALWDPLKDFNLVQQSPWEDRLLGGRHSGTAHYIYVDYNALAWRQKEDVPAIWKEILWFMVIFESVSKVKIFHSDLCQWHLWFRTSWREMGCTGEVLHGVKQRKEICCRSLKRQHTGFRKSPEQKVVGSWKGTGERSLNAYPFLALSWAPISACCW